MLGRKLMSLPMRERGLKLQHNTFALGSLLVSLPMRERGLKLARIFHPPL